MRDNGPGIVYMTSLVPNESPYETLYVHSTLTMSLSCSVSEILPIFMPKASLFHAAALLQLEFRDEHHGTDRCLFAT